MSLRGTLVAAGTFFTVMHLSDWRGQTVACTMSCQSSSQEASDGTRQDGKSTAVKLPRTNLAPVSAEVTAPIGIASQNRPILDKLENRRISLDVREVPLTNVVDSLRDQVGCNILLKRFALEEEGVTCDTPITAHLMDAPFGQGLNRILEQYNLTYVVEHGVILITSQLESANSPIFQVYPVADLVWMGEANGDQVIDYDPLIKLLQESIAPNSWSCVGGAGTIRPFVPNLSLAINQTQAAHEEIIKVLGALRKAREVIDQAERDPVVREARRPKGRLTDTAFFAASEREIEIRRVARELIITLDFNELPLADAIHFLSEYSKLPFDVDRIALEEEGVTTDTLISMKLSGVRLDDALYLLLEQWNLTWAVKHDVIFITSQLAAGNQLIPRSYPVRDLVVIGTGDARWSLFHVELQELIESIIAPNSWSNVGGAGTINYFPASQCLVVLQTQSVHERIAALLAAFRESTERFSEITRMAGMPTPEKLAELQLRAIRAMAD